MCVWVRESGTQTGMGVAWVCILCGEEKEKRMRKRKKFRVCVNTVSLRGTQEGRVKVRQRQRAG